jgi:small-conductance mechanosensitive channel
MKKNSQFKITSFGRRIIFGGPCLAFMVVYDNLIFRLDRTYHLNTFILISLVFTAIIANVLAWLYFYKRLPERFIIPIGLIGWILAFAFQFLRNWFGK